MNNIIAFQERGWENYIYQQTKDKKTLKKVNELIQDINRNGYTGLGKPEALTNNFQVF